MKYLFILSLMCLFNFSLSKCQNVKFKPSFEVVVDTSYGSTLLKQCSRSVPEHITGFWLIKPAEIESLENNFKNINNLTAKECCMVNKKINDLTQFAFQYLGVIIKGKKFIYINAFPLDEIKSLKEHHLNPAKTPVVVCDGGDSFWGVLFDVETKQFSSLAFNGAV